MKKRGLICAGGKGTRLLPITRVLNKHMCPIINKPMILWPLDTLKKMGCTDILIVTGGNDIGDIAEFLGDGSDYGVKLTYVVQPDAGGIAQAIACAEDFAQGEEITVILGDNIYEETPDNRDIPLGCQIYIKKVSDPSRFGCPVFDSRGYIDSVEEKPTHPKSDYAVTGLYIFPFDVFDVIRGLVPSARGELEVTDIINHYISTQDVLYHELHGYWSDSGTKESLLDVIKWASNTP
jgi:glucose-1-phosphate thymidylyltransferase